MLVVFVGFGAWAALAPLESAAFGTGTVQVDGDRKWVQHFEGGMIAEILVGNGDYFHSAAARGCTANNWNDQSRPGTVMF